MFLFGRLVLPMRHVISCLAGMLTLVGGTISSGNENNMRTGNVNAPAGYVVIACPAEFADAMQPWIAHREAQGYAVATVDNRGTAQEVRTRIHGAFPLVKEVSQTADDHPSAGGPSADDSSPTARPEILPRRFIVLVGDAPEQKDARPSPLTTATFFQPAKVNKALGGGEDIATDNPYADWDGDTLPDAAVGRLPVDGADELQQLVTKIVAYEAQAPGSWQRRINFIAGVGGFGLLADRAIEMGARKFICEGIPAAFSTSMTYASWRSPYYPGGANFGRATLDRFNEGSLFCVYIGHGSPRSLDFVREETPLLEQFYPILRDRDIEQLNCAQGPPIALFLACYTGKFDGPDDSLAEQLLRRKGGPIAAVCGSRVTMPYAMSVLGNELIQECFINGRRTLGELLLHAKRQSILKPREDETSQMLDNVATLLNVQGDLAAERREHLGLFNLIGDPLLPLNVPDMWQISAPKLVQAGKTVTISGMAEFTGSVQFELAVTRDRLTFTLPPRDGLLGGADEADELWQTYRRANAQTLAAAKTQVVAGQPFQVTLRVPDSARPGSCFVRMFATGESQAAIASAELTIE